MPASICDKVIDYLVRNRVSTTEVADALGKTGVVPDLMPINRAVHEQIQELEEDNIVFVDTFNCGNRAIFGELVSKYILLYRQSRAIVINGNMRDAAALIRENWPIWCKGLNPVGCFNRKPDKPFNEEQRQKNYEKYDGAIAVCDDCGVVIIPKDRINEEFYQALVKIENQEDIWFDLLDHYKENTFDIVCMKNYLKDENYRK